MYLCTSSVVSLFVVVVVVVVVSAATTCWQKTGKLLSEENKPMQQKGYYSFQNEKKISRSSVCQTEEVMYCRRKELRSELVTQIFMILDLVSEF